ncbi:unnamed protein product [Haemonchus placei]|uniref:mannosyl-oligosaccharide glucosidase n=1 Tax=Haemonchus placei TaxID=6290 RepID=A0A0N4W3L9_HAEPC|nr:unnamed protein product [Haemonchus placei]
MALSSRVMVRLAHLFEEEKYKNKYDDEASSLANYDELVRLHWSDDRKEFFAAVVREPKLGFVDDVFGYNSLFPLMLRLLPAESDTLSHILASLRDPERLEIVGYLISVKLIWSEYGLRSIAQSSPYYGARNTEHDPPYWRGNIWINVNYMVLSALNYYGSIPGPSRATARTAFAELKKNLVTNIAKVSDILVYCMSESVPFIIRCFSLVLTINQGR